MDQSSLQIQTKVLKQVTKCIYKESCATVLVASTVRVLPVTCQLKAR